MIPVDLDQEEVALKFQKYALISAAVVDPSGRLVGMITVDDIVHIIQEEAGEDVLLAVGRGRRRHQRADLRYLQGAGALARGEPDDRAGRLDGDPLLRGQSIERLAILAVLMPIVAGVGGNAGTQTLAVTVRAIATNQLTGSNRWRAVLREIRVALMNGLTIAVLIGVGVTLVLGSAQLGAVIAAAMLTNIVIAGFAGVMVPLGPRARGRRPGGRVERVRDHGHRFDGLPGVPRPGDRGGAGRLSL